MKILNKILRIIIGLPFVTSFYVMILIINAILVCGFGLYDWITGFRGLSAFSLFMEFCPLSPYQFVKNVCTE